MIFYRCHKWLHCPKAQPHLCVLKRVCRENTSVGSLFLSFCLIHIHPQNFKEATYLKFYDERNEHFPSFICIWTINQLLVNQNATAFIRSNFCNHFNYIRNPSTSIWKNLIPKKKNQSINQGQNMI